MLCGVPLQVDELLDHLMLACVACPEGCRETVDLGVVFAEVVETGVALAGTCRGGRVYPVQVGDDLPRGEQFAVTITRAVNRALFIMVVLELVRTIVARLEGGGFQLQPSLVIGIISATRDILTGPGTSSR